MGRMIVNYQQYQQAGKGTEVKTVLAGYQHFRKIKAKVSDFTLGEPHERDMLRQLYADRDYYYVAEVSCGETEDECLVTLAVGEKASFTMRASLFDLYENDALITLAPLGYATIFFSV